MKAAGIKQHGDLECFVVMDVPVPTPGVGEVLLEVKAAALNHLDIWLRKGRPGINYEFPHVLGCDASGVVAALGDNVDSLKVGDEVILNPGLSCGTCTQCHRGQHSQCDSYAIIGMKGWGTFAEKVVVAAENCYRKPPHLSFEQAAALPLAYLTAWRMLMTQAQCQTGETVLIHGIGGGVALAALQLAKLCGAEVIVTSSEDEKLTRAQQLGADHTINYRTSNNITKEMLDKTHGVGVDVVIDAVGAATVPVNLEVARKGGRIVHCGVTTGPVVEVNLATIYWKQLKILGSTMGSHGDFRNMINAVRVNGLKPVVDSVEPLDHAQAAQGRMESGNQFGKIVLVP